MVHAREARRRFLHPHFALSDAALQLLESLKGTARVLAVLGNRVNEQGWSYVDPTAHRATGPGEARNSPSAALSDGPGVSARHSHLQLSDPCTGARPDLATTTSQPV